MASPPLPLTWEDIAQARVRLRGVAHRTPVFISRQFNETAGCSVYFKAENLQRGGAFKFRGAYNKIHAEMEKGVVESVVAYSSGNHAQAVALTAKLLEIPAAIVMPSDAPDAKVTATRSYGADVIFYDRYEEDREEIGKRIALERNALLVPPFDDYLVMAGQGTAAAELLEEIPHLDFLLTPASGNGLLAGSCVASRHLNPRIGIFGVEPEAGNDTYLSFKKGERVRIPVPHTIADGLQTASPGKLTFPIVKRLANGILLVKDEEMIQVLMFLLERMKILVEPSGAAAAAAVFFKKADFEGKRVGVILSGGNVDLDRLRTFLTPAAKLT
jgi:threo-3-hydroxy-L-aspartate ammonia-lyase